MDKLKDLTQKRKRAHSKLLSLESNVYKAFLEMERVTFSNGALKKNRKSS